jgi:hypothetical protein
MQLPSILQGESRKRLVQGMTIGAIATVVIGFNWAGYGFGWVTAGGADKLAGKRVETAVIAALGPICADKFSALADVADKKLALAKADTWDRRKLFPEAWVSLPGTTYPNSDLVELCSALILRPQAAALVK